MKPSVCPKSRRGSVSVWLIVSAPLLVAALGMVLNLGFLWLARVEVHNAAASGALAGAETLNRGGSHDRIVRAAEQFAAVNEVQAARQSRGPQNCTSHHWTRAGNDIFRLARRERCSRLPRRNCGRGERALRLGDRTTRHPGHGCGHRGWKFVTPDTRHSGG